MHGSNFSDCKCQKIARGFIFAVAKCIFMIFVGKDFYGNMIKTLYCKPAEGKMVGNFLEAEPKISLWPKGRAVIEKPDRL